MFSQYFIDRPRFAIVLSLLLIIGGLLALVAMPVAQFPPITPPVVQVTANYPGANAETVESTVTIPVEQEVNGVDGMLYMSSQSSNNGTMTLSVTFAVGTDPDIAQVNVQNRVALAEARLPEETKRQGITVRKQSTAILLFIELLSPNGSFDTTFLSNYARINLTDRLLRLPGVGETQIFAGSYYSMRVWLDPPRMASLGISASDIAEAIREQNIQVATGQIGQMPVADDQQLRFALVTKGRLTDVEEFEDIIVRANPDGSLIRLADVGRVELGAETYDRFAYLDDSPAVPLAVFLQPGANALETARAVAETMADAATRFPKDMRYEIPYDTTKFVEESIIEVLKTLAIASALVILVVFVFLHDWRATLIPMATIPVSLIGALLILSMLGYSINTITLFGLILSIGIVVDDAIVVIENAQRLVGEGMPARPAAIETMRQVTGPVIATTLVLLAVFVPVGFLPGITGQLYQQFAVTLAAAVSISSLNALTLSPALCAALLGGAPRRPWLPLRLFERGFARVATVYGVVVAALLRRVAVVVVAFAALLAATYYGYVNLPVSFLPDEDQGYFFVDVQLPDGAALPRTHRVMDKIFAIMDETPGIDRIVRIGGFSLLAGASTNAALAVGVLEPWGDRRARRLDVQTIIGGLQPQFAAIQEAEAFAFNPPAVRGLGRTGGFEFQLQDFAGRSPQDLAAVMRAFVFTANQQPEMTRVFSSFQAEAPRISIAVDRRKAKTLGVPLEQVFATLQTQLGSYYVNDFNKFGRSFQVRLQAEPFARDDPEDILRLYVHNERGETIPLETLVSLSSTIGPETITRYNLYRSAQINGSAAPGYSSGDAIAAMERIAASTLPPGTGFEWTGLSLQEIKAGNVAPIIFALAFVFVYLSLVALYESWAVPFAVILSVPAALSGGIAMQLLLGQQSNIYSQIGLVLLIGLASKNAILIVEFALHEYRAGREVRSSALKAARLRFRAVMMTAFSFVLGTIPLVIATGAGGASRQSLGAPVFGGMIAAAVLGTIVVPVFFAAIQRRFERRDRHGRGASRATGGTGEA